MEEIFKIFRVDLAEAEKIASQTNEPHNHRFEELLIGREGQLEHFIDFHAQLMDAPFISFVTQGKLHRVRPLPKNGKCDIWVLRFKSEFIANTIFQRYASFHDNANISMQENRCFERLDTICAIMYEEYLLDSPDFSVIRDLLNALFSMIESEKKKLHLHHEENNRVQSAAFRNFLKLLDIHFREPHDVNFYAEKLFMTTRNLNLTCQSILHQSVSEIIETRKLTEAKNLLITTGMSVAEIGYELGYQEKTYFTHTFKKKAGMTPTDFRKQMAQLLS